MGKTYKEWRAAGKHVIKGQKATGRNEAGEATFTKSQVAEDYNPRDEGYEYEGSWEETIGDTEWYH